MEPSGPLTMSKRLWDRPAMSASASAILQGGALRQINRLHYRRGDHREAGRCEKRKVRSSVRTARDAELRYELFRAAVKSHLHSRHVWVRIHSVQFIVVEEFQTGLHARCHDVRGAGGLNINGVIRRKFAHCRRLVAQIADASLYQPTPLPLALGVAPDFAPIPRVIRDGGISDHSSFECVFPECRDFPAGQSHANRYHGKSTAGRFGHCDSNIESAPSALRSINCSKDIGELSRHCSFRQATKPFGSISGNQRLILLKPTPRGVVEYV